MLFNTTFSTINFKGRNQSLERLTKDLSKQLKSGNPINIIKLNKELCENIDELKLSTPKTRENITGLFKRVAELAVSLKEQDIGSIIYSFLLKINSKDTAVIEEIATRSLAIAKRNHDPIHIAARAFDLSKILNEACKTDKTKEKKLLSVLHEEKRALKDICKKYKTTTKDKFHSCSKRIKPIENYKEALGNVRIKIATLSAKENPKLAIEELKSAYAIFTELNHIEKLKKINYLLTKFHLLDK